MTWSYNAHKTWASYGLVFMLAAVGCDVRNAIHDLTAAVRSAQVCK